MSVLVDDWDDDDGEDVVGWFVWFRSVVWVSSGVFNGEGVVVGLFTVWTG